MDNEGYLIEDIFPDFWESFLNILKIVLIWIIKSLRGFWFSVKRNRRGIWENTTILIGVIGTLLAGYSVQAESGDTIGSHPIAVVIEWRFRLGVLFIIASFLMEVMLRNGKLFKQILSFAKSKIDKTE